MSMFLIWAYHTSSDVNNSAIMKHTAKGFKEVTFIPAPQGKQAKQLALPQIYLLSGAGNVSIKSLP